MGSNGDGWVLVMAHPANQHVVKITELRQGRGIYGTNDSRDQLKWGFGRIAGDDHPAILVNVTEQERVVGLF